MLTGLKILFLASKCVFYGPEHNAQGKPHGIEFQRSWNAKSEDDYLSSYHDYSQSYGHKNVKKDSFLYFLSMKVKN